MIGPRLLNPDGTLQRSVRGFPTAWRLATEYLYLRKLAPRSRALNAFYGAGFDHASEREVEWVMGSCMLVRRAAFDEVGPFDERYFLFSEEVDWMRRATDRGWSVVFTPEARCVHVGGASHGGRLFRENVRGHLRYLSLHGRPGEAERARGMLRASLAVRGRLHRGERGRLYREVAAWLGSGDVEALLTRMRPLAIGERGSVAAHERCLALPAARLRLRGRARAGRDRRAGARRPARRRRGRVVARARLRRAGRDVRRRRRRST